MCSVTSASTMSRFGAALAPKSTAITLASRRGFGGASVFSVPAIHLRGRLGEIEIAIDAIGHALAAERRETLVDRLADGAELHIGGVAERQHAEFDAVEPRRRIAHQLLVGAGRARGRLALAPGGGDHDERFTLASDGELEVRHVDERGLEAELARGLRDVAGELLGIAGLGRVEDRQRLGRLRRCGRRDRGGASPAAASRPARNPASQARCIGVRRADDAIEDLDLVVGERRGLRDGRCTHDTAP